MEIQKKEIIIKPKRKKWMTVKMETIFFFAETKNAINQFTKIVVILIRDIVMSVYREEI